MLCSGALADDFSRMIRSPPGALGPPLVGFIEIVLTRIAYAIGTSPATVTVLDSLVLPPLQAASIVASVEALRIQSLFFIDLSSFFY
jgi:hypothetical protein